MFIDSHAHIYDLDVNGVIARAKDALVDYIICPSSNAESSLKSIKIASEQSMVFACIGFHPEDITKFDSEEENFLLENAKNNKKVVAIGEIGLDYHFGNSNIELQKKAFVSQLKIADKLNLPVVIHIRDAMPDALEILGNNKKYLKNGGFVHCFNGNIDEARKIMDLGLCFTIGGICTFKKSADLRQTLSQIPLDRIALETDSPYLAPEPLRGSVNEPKNIPIIAQKLAEIKGESVENVAKITSLVARRVFRI